MPLMSKLGSAVGAQGGLNDYLAQQLLMQKQAEVERAAREQEAFNQHQLATNDAYRRDALAAAQSDREERAKDREEGRKLQRVQLSLGRPMGAEITPEEYAYDTKELGIPGSYYDQQKTGGEVLESGLTAPEGPTVIRFRGKEADQLKRQTEAAKEAALAEQESGQNSRNQLDNQTKLLIAQLVAASKPDPNQRLQGEMRIVNYTDPQTGLNMVKSVNALGEERILGIAPQTPGAQAKQATLDALSGQIGDILQGMADTKGSATGWGQATMGKAKALFNREDPANNMLRSAINSVRADIAHEKYGSAFTKTEQGMLSSFAPTDTDSDENIITKFSVMKYVTDRRRQELSNGLVPGQGATPLTELMKEARNGGKIKVSTATAAARATNTTTTPALQVRPQGASTAPAGTTSGKKPPIRYNLKGERIP